MTGGVDLLRRRLVLNGALSPSYLPKAVAALPTSVGSPTCLTSEELNGWLESIWLVGFSCSLVRVGTGKV